ncbi:MAG: hydrogenase expression/formation protein HypE, partial [Thermoproteota archaeon]|nr:hydrogenase expression/formation protein HypE [Thermoproteota archaeon]
VAQRADDVLKALHERREGRDAEIIGEATNDFGEVVIETEVGGRRILAPPVGDPIPRIC